MTDQQTLLHITSDKSYNPMTAGEIISVLEKQGLYSPPRVPIRFIDK